MTKYQPEQEQKAIEQLVVTSQQLSITDELCKALKKIAESPLTDQIAVALSLRAKAYTDQAIAEDTWKILSDAAWRLKVLVNVETRVLGLLFEAFSIVQVDSRGKWFSLFPHYIAELCENADDRERRRLFFLYLLHISLASDTVSAVRRLLRGDHKKKFVELVREYRDRVEAMRSEYPPWVAGKLRGLIANLRIV